MHIGSILPISIYMCTVRKNLQLLGKTLNQYHAKCMLFSKINSFRIAIQRFCMNHYPSLIYTKIQPYIFPMLRLRFFGKVQELKNPNVYLYLYFVSTIDRIVRDKHMR